MNVENKESEACRDIIVFDKKMKELFGNNPLRKALIGKYGEILVINEFKRRGFDVKTAGNLTSYDLIVNGYKIEVRTSEVKRERAFPEKIRAWGWKLQTRNRSKEPKEIKYNFIILVQLYDDWTKFKLYLLSREQIEKMKETYFTGYQTVARAIYLFQNNLKEAVATDKHKMITRTCIKFNKNPSKFMLDWTLIRKILI